MSHLPTPRLTDHARRRCLEMGVTTKRVKRFVQHADVRYPASPAHPPGRMFARWEQDPELCVVYQDTNPPVVVTVLFRADEEPFNRGDGRLAGPARYAEQENLLVGRRA